MEASQSVPYVLGIDSGGTRYRVRAVSLDDQPLGEYEGLPCSHDRVPEAEVARRLTANIQGCLVSFGGKAGDCRAIVCGTTGCDSPEDAAFLQDLYRRQLPDFRCPMTLMSDVELAFRMICGNLGLLILSGTGSICYGKNSRDESARVGGWPVSIFGDEGSGRYIDALALQYYSRWMDGCREDAELLRVIREKTGIQSRKELIDYAGAIALGRVPAPNLGAEVTRAANEGNPWAQTILRDAASRLASLAEDAIQRLQLNREETIPVGLWGSVLQHSGPVRGALTGALKREYPQIEILPVVTDAAQGAVRIALDSL